MCPITPPLGTSDIFFIYWNFSPFSSASIRAIGGLSLVSLFFFLLFFYWSILLKVKWPSVTMVTSFCLLAGMTFVSIELGVFISTREFLNTCYTTSQSLDSESTCFIFNRFLWYSFICRKWWHRRALPCGYLLPCWYVCTPLLSRGHVQSIGTASRVSRMPIGLLLPGGYIQLFPLQVPCWPLLPKRWENLLNQIINWKTGSPCVSYFMKRDSAYV